MDPQPAARSPQLHVVVIGAGPYGLEAAAWAKSRGHRVTVLERQNGLGGDWRLWGNPWSTLQSHKSGYLFAGPPTAVPGEADLPAYPSRDQMLRYFQSYATASGIADHIWYGCTATGRTGVSPAGGAGVSRGRGGGVTAAPPGTLGTLGVNFIDASGAAQTIEATHVFAAPGRVNRRRELSRWVPCTSPWPTAAPLSAVPSFSFPHLSYPILGHVILVTPL